MGWGADVFRDLSRRLRSRQHLPHADARLELGYGLGEQDSGRALRRELPLENDLLRAELQANQPWDGLLIKVASHRGADVRLEQTQRFALGEH